MKWNSIFMFVDKNTFFYLCVFEIATTSPVIGSLVISSESGSIRINPPLRLSSDNMSLTRVSECKLGGFWTFSVGLTRSGACCCPNGLNCCCWNDWGCWLKLGWNDWGCWLELGRGCWLKVGWNDWGCWLKVGWNDWGCWTKGWTGTLLNPFETGCWTKLGWKWVCCWAKLGWNPTVFWPNSCADRLRLEI